MAALSQAFSAAVWEEGSCNSALPLPQAAPYLMPLIFALISFFN